MDTIRGLYDRIEGERYSPYNLLDASSCERLDHIEYISLYPKEDGGLVD